MTHDSRTLSAVREKSSFASPPRVLVVADDDTAGEALALAEALDSCGAEAEVRLTEDTTADEYGDPDAVIVAGSQGEKRAHDFLASSRHPVLVAVAGGRGWKAGADFDMIVDRPVNASALLQRLGTYLSRM